MAQIKVDQEKCLSPQDCCKCQESCPQKIFWTYPKEGRKPGKSASDWVIVPVLPSLCTACMACERICPQNAIKITPGRETAAAAGKAGMIRNARRVTAGLGVWVAKKAYVP